MDIENWAVNLLKQTIQTTNVGPDEVYPPEYNILMKCAELCIINKSREEYLSFGAPLGCVV